jgi:hypothetical protein
MKTISTISKNYKNQAEIIQKSSKITELFRKGIAVLFTNMVRLFFVSFQKDVIAAKYKLPLVLFDLF